MVDRLKPFMGPFISAPTPIFNVSFCGPTNHADECLHRSDRGGEISLEDELEARKDTEWGKWQPG